MSAVLERLLAKVEEDPETNCWIWQGHRDRDGYGRIRVPQRRMAVAHRVAYELLVGPISPGLVIDHLCRRRSCVNPGHLEPVTDGENQRRSPIANASLTHCRRGHPFDEANTYRFVQNGGWHRACRACRRLADKRRTVSV